MTDDALLHLVYAAALDTSLWPKVLGGLSARFGCTAAALFDGTFVTDGQPGGMRACLGYSDKALADFTAYFRHRDMRVRRTVHAAATGHVYFDDRDIAFAELDATEIQTDFYRPNDVGHIGGVLLAKRSAQFSVLSVHRSLGFGPFDVGEVMLLDRLAPHLVRAWEITATLRRTSEDASALVTGLDMLRGAIFLVDLTGKIRRMSADAERLVRADKCLRIRQGRLEACNPAANGALMKLLGAAMAMPELGTAPDPGILALRSADGATTLTLFVAPAGSDLLGRGPVVLVFASDPRSSRPLDPLLLARQFGFSRTEARVAAALSEGSSVAEMAERLAVSAETIRTHLKHAMAKCDVHSQVELARLVLSSIGVLRRQ
jgi:DNA-binding CsgD family transcriptional regulator